jgi:hypothetical protein
VNYFLARSGQQQQDQYSLNDLEHMVADGSAAVTDLVWQEGMASWVPLMNVLPVPGPGGMAAAPLPLPPPPMEAVPPALMPPSMPWVGVFFLGFFTLGIFYWIWAFKQSNFVRKLNQADGSRILLILGVIAAVVSRLGVLFIRVPEQGLTAVFQVASFVAMVVAAFKMRESMMTYYNMVEPMNLRLSAPMTFFFNILYLQYHLSRIASRKATGVLVPNESAQ